VFTISFPELRSLCPAVEKHVLWEQPFQACAIACHRCSLRLRSEPDNQNPVISYCYFKTDAPKALVFRPRVKGNEALGTRLVCSRFFVVLPGDRVDFPPCWFKKKSTGRLLLFQRNAFTSLSKLPELTDAASTGSQTVLLFLV